MVNSTPTASRNESLYANVVHWEDIPMEYVRPGVHRRVYSTDDVMFSWHSLEVGMETNPHSHDSFDQLVYISEGVCDYYVSGKPHRMVAGSFMLVPAGAVHYIVPVEAPCINIDIFTPPRQDFLSPTGDAS